MSKKRKPMFRLFAGLKGYVLPVTAATVFALGGVIISILAPTYLGDLTDTITAATYLGGVDLERITHLGILLVVLYGLSFVFNYLGSLLLNRVSQLYAYDLREQLSLKINKLPLSYFDGHQYGDTLSIITNDVDQMGSSLQQGVSMVVTSVLTIVGVLVAMFVTSWPMALTVLASLPLMILFLLMVTKLAMPRFKKRQDLLGEVNAVVEEQFSGLLVIKAFGAEKKKSEEFEKENQHLNKVMFSAQIFGGLMQPVNMFISYFVYAAVCVVGGVLMGEGLFGVSFGTITAFLLYANLFQSPLGQLGQAMNTLQMGAASAERVYDMLEEGEVSDDSHLPDRFEEVNGKKVVRGEVSFQDVHFSYEPGHEIIKGFSCEVKPGMKVAIVGPTGAGKTTIVNLLMRFYEIDSGSIKIDGIDCKDLKREEIRDLFGMVLQDTWVFDGTIRENIVYDKEGVSDSRLREVLKESNLLHYVETLPGGLDYRLEGEGSMSAGQRQMMTIARAMVEDAPMLILDEATSNVDTRTEELIQEAMDRLTEGRTSFVIAHRLSTIKNADLILVLDKGNVVEIGSHESLLEKGGFYASLYNAQFALEGN